MRKQRGIIATVYLVLAGLLASGAMLTGAAFAWKSYTNGIDKKGYDRGVAEKVAEYDKLIGIQKSQAATILAKVNADNITLMTARDKFKSQLEKDHANYQANVDALRKQYSGRVLRFRTIQGAGCGGGGGSTESPSSGSAVPAAATGVVVQLPDALTARLRQRAITADEWLGWYRVCYAYVNQVK